ncbi:MAG: hypothetical protein HY741_22630 [Chloroflexi bacterium]|nr:hypothetical protein [Chloroflexota bacterium]
MAQEPFMNQTDAQLAWDDLRTSPAFPAIVGGLAGALGGAALMFVLSRLTKPKETLPAAYDANGNPMNVVYLPAPQQPRILGFTVGDLMTLGSIGIGLYRQVQNMRRIENLEKETQMLESEMASPAAPTLSPSPARLPVSPRKK